MQSQLEQEEYKETELGLLPKEWKVVNINLFVDFDRGVSWRKEEASKKGTGIPVLGIPNIKEKGNIDYSEVYFLNKTLPNNKILKDSDLLFVGSSGSLKNICRNVIIRKTKLPPNNFTFASFTFRARVKDENTLNSLFFYYLMNSTLVNYVPYSRRAADGKYNFQLTEFKKRTVIPLPPLPEQEKIAYVLSTIQEAIEKTEKVINSLKELKKSMMKHLFTYGPVSLEDAEKVELKETEIGKVPKDWDIVELGQIAKQQEKVVVNSDNFISFEHIESETGKILYVDSAKKYKTKTPFAKGTLLYGRIRPYLNKVWLADRDGFCSTDIIRIVPINSDISFLKYILLSHVFVKFATSKSTGTKMPRVKWNAIASFKLALPPLPIQQQIAAILSEIDFKIVTEENKKKALDELFKSMLHNLMTAKIRVNNLEI